MTFYKQIKNEGILFYANTNGSRRVDCAQFFLSERDMFDHYASEISDRADKECENQYSDHFKITISIANDAIDIEDLPKYDNLINSEMFLDLLDSAKQVFIADNESQLLSDHFEADAKSCDWINLADAAALDEIIDNDLEEFAQRWDVIEEVDEDEDE
jgi:hypothetical protein